MIKLSHLLATSLFCLYSLPLAAVEAIKEPEKKGPQEGVNVALFVPTVANEWPLKSLPEEPSEKATLQKLPKVLPQMTVANEHDGRIYLDGNTLIASRLGKLHGVASYAVRFSGYFYAPTDGDYVFALRSDDPVTLSIDGNLIAEHQHSALIPWKDESIYESRLWTFKDGFGHRNFSTKTASGQVSLVGGKFYRVEIMAHQRRNLAAFDEWLNTEVTHKTHSGAHFDAVVIQPSPESHAYYGTSSIFQSGASSPLVLFTSDS